MEEGQLADYMSDVHNWPKHADKSVNSREETEYERNRSAWFG